MNKLAVAKLSLFSVFLMLGTFASTQNISAKDDSSQIRKLKTDEESIVGQVKTEKAELGNNSAVQVSRWSGKSARARIVEELNQAKLHIQIFESENMGEVICRTEQSKISKSNLDLIFELKLVNFEEDSRFSEEDLDKMSDFYFGDSQIVRIYQILDEQPEYSTEYNSILRSYFVYPTEQRNKRFPGIKTDSVRLSKGRVSVTSSHFFAVSEDGDIASIDFSSRLANGIPKMTPGLSLQLKDIEESARVVGSNTIKYFTFTGSITAVLCKMEQVLKQ